MEVIVGEKAGFCNGVRNTVNKAEKIIKKAKEPIYCLGPISHNEIIIDRLEKEGLIFINDITEAKGKTIIRSHGDQKSVYEYAKKNNIELLDLTCPKIIEVRKKAEEYSKNGFYIFYIAEKEHPETKGVFSFIENNACIIYSIDEIDSAIKKLRKTEIKKLLIIAQTTFNLKIFYNIVEEIKEKLPKDIELIVENTICNATELRQKETEEISKKVDAMIIIGGKHSSNTNKLYDIAKENCKNVFFVLDKTELNFNQILKFNKIGIMAGASTPQDSIDDIVNLLKKEEN